MNEFKNVYEKLKEMSLQSKSTNEGRLKYEYKIIVSIDDYKLIYCYFQKTKLVI